MPELSISPDNERPEVFGLTLDRRQPVVARLEGNVLENFLNLMTQMAQPLGDRPRVLRFWVDPVDGGLKLKANEYSWGPAYGELEQ